MEVVQIDTGVLYFEMLPELGGKISSLKDLRTGREWLWKNPRLEYKRGLSNRSYVEAADTGGWDECFPTVAACSYPSDPWAGVDLQDHGELWSQAVEVAITEEKNRVTLRTQWQGIALPYTFERSVTFEAGSARLLFEYTLISHADMPMHFIWSAHPLLAIEPGMRLVFPQTARFNCALAIPEDFISQKNGLVYPPSLNSDLSDVDLTSLPDASAGLACKLWSNPLADGWAALCAKDGEFRLSWDATRLPQVALWMNIGAWAGDGGQPYYNVGLEPCIGAQDSLADAVTVHKLFDTLSPQAVRTWQLEILLSQKENQ